MVYHQNEEIINLRNKSYYRQLKEANKKPISANLFNIYPEIDLPTSKDLLSIRKQLAKEDKSIVYKMIDKMLTTKKFKDFFAKNVATL
jgi:hypothetical protein